MTEPAEIAEDKSPATEWREGLSYEEVSVAASGKRCGVQWSPWMGDWFNSESPRNGNMNAEGPWDHWVDLALHILADPLTKIVRPDFAHATYQGQDFYSGANRYLTDEELHARFNEEAH